MSDSTPTAQLLLDWRAGQPGALDRLLPRVYDELRGLAYRSMSGERRGHTLQATALVHEAFVRMVDMDVAFNDRAHFLAMAARTMRRILVDHARERGRQKRGGGWSRTTLEKAAIISADPGIDLLALDVALDRLARQDERKAKAIELHYFGGLKYDELAAVLGISEATVHRDLAMARAWLFRELDAGA